MYFAKDVTDKIQHVLNLKHKDKNIKLAEDSIKKILTDQEKDRILKCIRYSYLPQDVLLKLSTDPCFMLAKELIVQGIACKLGGIHQF